MRLQKTLILAFATLPMTMGLASCQKEERIVPDYATSQIYEAALNKGEDTTGKTVCFSVDSIHPDSAFGFNIWSGEHLNFLSDKDPGAKEGDKITGRVVSTTKFLDSWLIKYDLIYIN